MDDFLKAEVDKLKTDKYIGERFETKDKRDPGRRVHVLHLTRNQKNVLQPDRYLCEVYYNPATLNVVGYTKLSAKTLDTYFRKVSH